MADRLLLDTHAFLWSVSSSKRLSKRARQAILKRENQVFISRVSYWEICLKISVGKLTLADGWQERLEAERKTNRLNWLDIDEKHCEGILSLPWHHKDPFDRLLISQAQCEHLSLVSCDEKMNPYQVDIIW